MTISFEYPCTRAGEPRRLTAKAISACAGDLRSRLFGPAIRPVDVDQLVRRSRQARINGAPMTIVWDLGHAVHDDSGVPVLGVCEHDPAEPRTVMISLNSDLLADEPHLLRSTAAHELAHALFDMPAAFGAGSRRTFRTTSAAGSLLDQTPIDWSEWRADEFMGSFLVPPDRLARALARQAGAQGLKVSWAGAGGGRPKIEIAFDEPELGWLTDALAETFGVSTAFMAVRLHKSGFIVQRGR